jgi:hypothetical protein
LFSEYVHASIFRVDSFFHPEDFTDILFVKTYLGRSSIGGGRILVDTLIWFSLRMLCLSNKYTPDIPVIVSSY